ncbi:MAG TPA: hypothetical protein VG099_27760, partial [Gemmataceae bacterium]|nr:hypothetical protein [Gemmataceae bacterium]
MATTASFKQQCPSCEAMVPIRDPNLIGRKIDCPKCKYRFVVEDPGTSADEDEDVKPGKRDNGKGAKSKTGARRRDEDDEDEEDVAAKKSGGNNKLVLGIGLSVVAVGLLGVVGYLLFASGDSSSKSSSTPAPAPVASKPQENEAPKDTEKKEEAAAGSAVSAEFLSNLLPPDTEGVCLVHMQDLMRTTLGRAMFESPGSFRSDALQRRLGFSIDDVDVIVQGWNFSQNWSLNVVHTTKPLDLERVQAALRAKPVEEKDRIEGQEYFILDNNPWLDMLGQASFAMVLQANPAMIPPRSGARAMRVYDTQTLVFADARPMQTFLSKKGVFDKKSPDAPAPSGDAKPKDGGDEAAGGAPGMRMRMGMGGMGGPQGMGGNPMMQQQQGNQPKPEEAAPSGAYLTIEPALKTMLDRVEEKHPVVSLALDTLAAQRGRISVQELKLLNLATVFQDASIIGAALHLKDGVTVMLGASYRNDDDAAKHLKSTQKQDGPDLATLLSKAMDIKVEFTEEDPEQAALQAGEGMPGMGGRGMGMGMPGMGMPGTGMPGMGTKPSMGASSGGG